MLLENGKCIEFTEDGAYRRDPVQGGQCWWVRDRWRRLKKLVVRDRKHLSEEGVVIPIIAIDKHTGRWNRRRKL